MKSSLMDEMVHCMTTSYSGQLWALQGRIELHLSGTTLELSPSLLWHLYSWVSQALVGVRLRARHVRRLMLTSIHVLLPESELL